ncbi:MAG: GNAT family N-acetyltransferase [Gemmatimonadales bacterium]
MPFEFQPTLHGELLALRPLRDDDHDALFAVASDPLIWEQHPDSDRWKPLVFRRFFDDAMASGGALIALDRVSGAVIGSSRYHGWTEPAREVEISWIFLARTCWDPTIATSAPDCAVQIRWCRSRTRQAADSLPGPPRRVVCLCAAPREAHR